MKQLLLLLLLFSIHFFNESAADFRKLHPHAETRFILDARFIDGASAAAAFITNESKAWQLLRGLDPTKWSTTRSVCHGRPNYDIRKNIFLSTNLASTAG